MYCVERKGRFLGYVVTRRLAFKALAFLVVVDFLLDPELTYFGRLALRLSHFYKHPNNIYEIKMH